VSCDVSKTGEFDRKFSAECADEQGMTFFLNALLDHLIRHFGRVVGFALFGFLFSSVLLLPCSYLGLISPRNALIEAASASAWMAAASMILLVLSGGQEEE
jgi:hypothetical protein